MQTAPVTAPKGVRMDVQTVVARVVKAVETVAMAAVVVVVAALTTVTATANANPAMASANASPPMAARQTVKWAPYKRVT